MFLLSEGYPDALEGDVIVLLIFIACDGGFMPGRELLVA
jgi:hypothetical protein